MIRKCLGVVWEVQGVSGSCMGRTGSVSDWKGSDRECLIVVGERQDVNGGGWGGTESTWEWYWMNRE